MIKGVKTTHSNDDKDKLKNTKKIKLNTFITV